MVDCEQLIQKGVILRTIITFISFYCIYLYLQNKWVMKYLYLIVPIILTLSDHVDNFFLYSFNSFFPTKNKCSKLFYYHIYDKITDSLSYVLTYLFLLFFLNNDPLLLFFVMYRIVGVCIFSFTKDSSWLILFFDFVKEYLLYLFLFGKNFDHLPIFIALKIMFESLFHTIINPNHYI